MLCKNFYTITISLLLILYLVENVIAISGECVSLKNNANNEKFDLVYDWNYINFTWPNENVYQEAVKTGRYIPENNAIVGVKYYNEKLYLALPKAKVGAPVTLAWVNQYPDKNVHSSNPLLTPYPNWKMNTDSDCRALQNVQSMEIDRKGIMWVLDGRRIDNHDQKTKCPPKIVLLDLNAGGRVIKNYIVPNDVCNHDSCFLNDIVVDEYDGGYAYITDTSSDPGIIVYSRKSNRAWKVRDQKSMSAEPEVMNFYVHGYIQAELTPIDGIAMDPPDSLDDPNRLVYYSAITGVNVYALNSSVLRNENLATSSKVSNYVMHVVKRTGPSDGLVMDSEGDLYFGILTDDSVVKLNTKERRGTMTVVDQNPNWIIWPDSFGFDPFGNLYLVANHINKFLATTISIHDVNFRLLKLYTGTCSYLY